MVNKDKFFASRRDFLKMTAIAGAGVAAVAAGCAPKAATSGADLEWGKEADIVVVGTGTVAVAALVAAKEGAKVIVLEKSPAFGGTTATSGGGFWVPNNYAMKEQGIEDSREMAVSFLQRVTDGQSTDELINAYVDAAPVMTEYLRDQFGWKFATNTSLNFGDYYPGEGSVPYGRTIYMANDDGTLKYGFGTYQEFKAKLDEMGAEVLFETPAKSLITNEAGEVIGVVAESAGSEINIKANKAVILGTGGFDHDKTWAKHFLRGPIYYTNAALGNTGDGQKMGMMLGASLRNMNESWGLPAFVLDPEKQSGEADWQTFRGKPGAIVVNKYGERIGNEACPYEQFQRSFWYYDSGLMEYRNTPSFWIADATYAQYYPLPGGNYQVGVEAEWLTKADTLEELCEKLGINYAGLQATLEVFNPNAEQGIDPVWHRGENPFDVNTAGDYTGRTDLVNVTLAPVATGPFYGAAYYPGTCGTNGGLEINANGQVLHLSGQPIPRLYAVGNTSGSVMGAAYPGGGSTLGAGFTFSYLAVKHALTLAAVGEA
jgi:3-oxosteroid 1-dehydrogenase